MNLTLQDPLLQRWFSFALGLPDAAFVPAPRAGDRLFDPEYETKNALEGFLQGPVVSCPPPLGAGWRAYPAAPGEIDLLTCEYDATDFHLRVLRGRSFMMVGLDLKEQTRLRRDQLEEMLRKFVLLNVDFGLPNYRRAWEFELPDELDAAGPPRLFSTRGARPIPDIMRDDRADILTYEGTLYFIFYPVPDQILGLLPDDKWFTPEARAALRGDAGK